MTTMEDNSFALDSSFPEDSHDVIKMRRSIDHKKETVSSERHPSKPSYHPPSSMIVWKRNLCNSASTLSTTDMDESCSNYSHTSHNSYHQQNSVTSSLSQHSIGPQQHAENTSTSVFQDDDDDLLGHVQLDQEEENELLEEQVNSRDRQVHQLHQLLACRDAQIWQLQELLALQQTALQMAHNGSTSQDDRIHQLEHSQHQSQSQYEALQRQHLRVVEYALQLERHVQEQQWTVPVPRTSPQPQPLKQPVQLQRIHVSESPLAAERHDDDDDDDDGGGSSANNTDQFNSSNEHPSEEPPSSQDIPPAGVQHLIEELSFFAV